MLIFKLSEKSEWIGPTRFLLHVIICRSPFGSESDLIRATSSLYSFTLAAHVKRLRVRKAGPVSAARAA
jgi:hypothetical protein